jgi:hypothetical protein
MPIRSDTAFDDDKIENLRLGTREQYESGWRLIEEGEDFAFQHNLGEVPWVVDVLYSEESNGGNARDGNSDTTVTKTFEEITCQNDFTDGRTRYFKVRAM